MKKKIVLAVLGVLVVLAGGGYYAIRGGNTHLREGQAAPDFALQSDEGRTVRLSDYKGKQNVVLYFYPRDETPGCTQEACSFRDAFAEFKKSNVEVLGVSVDSVESHKEFRRKQNLTFTLLSDTDKAVSKAYGVLNLMQFSKRVTFIIDRNGIIRKIYPEVDPSEHAKETLAVAQSL